MTTEKEVHVIEFDIGDSEKQLQKLDKLLENITKGATSKGFAKIGASLKKLDKPLKAINEGLKNAEKRTKTAGASFNKNLGKPAVKALDNISTSAKKSASSIDKLGQSTRRMANVDGAKRKIKELDGAIKKTGRSAFMSSQSIRAGFGPASTRVMDNTSRAVRRTNKAIDDTSKKTRRAATGFRQISSAAQQRRGTSLQPGAKSDTLRSSEKAVNQLGVATSRTTAKINRLYVSLKKIDSVDIVRKLAKLNLVLGAIDKTATKAGMSVRKSMGRNTARTIGNVSNAIERTNDSLEASEKQARRTGNAWAKFANASQNVGAGLQRIDQGINRYVLAPMAAISVGAIKAAFDINEQMANVSTMISGGVVDAERLREGVQEMAIATGKSTSDLSGGLYDVISNLGESAENMDQLGIAAKASVAGVAETGDSLKLLALVGKAYNDVSSESLQRISDLAFQTVKMGSTTFPELAASMGKVTPIAQSLNISQEELFGTMATLTGVSGNTSEVTTQLSAVFSSFLKPSEDLETAVQRINKQHKEYNFATPSAMMKTLGLKKSLELVGGTVDNNSDKLASMLGTKEALVGVLPLLGSQSENYEMKLAAMQEAVGATDAAYRKQTEGINKQGHEWKKTKQRMIVFAQKLGQRLLPFLDKLIDRLEPMLEYLEGLDEAAIDNALSFGKLVVEMALLFKALKGINSLAGGFSKFLSGMPASADTASKGFKGLIGKIGALSGGIFAAASAYEALSVAHDAWAARGEKKKEERDIKEVATTDVINQMDKFSTQDLRGALREEKKLQEEIPTGATAALEGADDFWQSVDHHLNISGGERVMHPSQVAELKVLESQVRIEKLKKEIDARDTAAKKKAIKESIKESIARFENADDFGVEDFEEQEAPPPPKNEKPRMVAKKKVAGRIRERRQPTLEQSKIAQAKATKEITNNNNTFNEQPSNIVMGKTEVNINNAGGVVDERTIQKAMNKANKKQARELREAANRRGRASI